MIKKIINRVFLFLTMCCFAACKVTDSPADTKLLTDANLLHRNVNQLTQVIIYDVFSPPVSSRIYAYTSLAAYEAMRFENPDKPSLVERMQGFSKMPQPEKGKGY